MFLKLILYFLHHSKFLHHANSFILYIVCSIYSIYSIYTIYFSKHTHILEYIFYVYSTSYILKYSKKRLLFSTKNKISSTTSLTSFNRFNFPRFSLLHPEEVDKKLKDFLRSAKLECGLTYIFYIFIFIAVIKNAGLAERGELGGREQRTRNVRGRRNPKKMDTFPILWRENRASLIANFRFAAR